MLLCTRGVKVPFGTILSCCWVQGVLKYLLELNCLHKQPLLLPKEPPLSTGNKEPCLRLRCVHMGRNRFSGFPFRKGFWGLSGRRTWLQPKSWIKLQNKGKDFQWSNSALLGRCWPCWGLWSTCWLFWELFWGSTLLVSYLTVVQAFNGLMVKTAGNKRKKRESILKDNCSAWLPYFKPSYTYGSNKSMQD